jgi:hypothetical protein
MDRKTNAIIEMDDVQQLKNNKRYSLKIVKKKGKQLRMKIKKP